VKYEGNSRKSITTLTEMICYIEINLSENFRIFIDNFVVNQRKVTIEEFHKFNFLPQNFATVSDLLQYKNDRVTLNMLDTFYKG